MTVDDLARHLDARMDRQDEAHKELADKVTDLQIEGGVIRTLVTGMGEACKARHESNSKKIAGVHRVLGGLGLGVVAAAGKFVWDAVTRKGG